MSWMISEEFQTNYTGTGIATPGTLRNQLVVRYHSIPESYGDGTLSGRIPCRLQFGETCLWCGEKTKAEKRLPRAKQPQNYFRDVIAKFKAKDKTLMMFEVWKQDEHGNWGTDGKLRTMEFTNYLKNGRTFGEILNARANDADRRIRIDKKTYAGYVSPVAIKIAFSWPIKEGKPDKSQFATWSPADATPFPVEAGGPDVSKFTKEWAHDVASLDPAAWINKAAFANVVPADVGRDVYDVFTGAKSLAPKVDLDTADFGQLLSVINTHKEKFDAAGVDPAEYDYSTVEPLRAIVKGVLNG